MTRTKEELEQCKEDVARNIVNVAIGEPLDMPLATLNRSCNFRKVWDKFAGADLEKKEKRRKYLQKPEVKERMRKYKQKYYQKPEVKEKRRKYKREYYLKKRENERKNNR